MTHAETKIRNEQMQEYKAQGHTHKEVAERFGVSFKTAKRICTGIAPQHATTNQNTKHTEEEIKQYVESFMGDVFSYVGGYIDCEHKVTIRCNKCGDVFERSMGSIRHRAATCDNCKRIEAEAKAEAEKEKRKEQHRKEEENRKAREAKKAERLAKTRTVICEECGKEFITTNPKVVCCSTECSKKRANRISSHRKDDRIKPHKRIDRDITAKKLYDRDNGVCWICGGKCDLNDYIVRDGNIICGNNYPSVDHVVPVCEGGEDSWKNVRLAHRYCNSARYWGKITPPPKNFFASSWATGARAFAKKLSPRELMGV